MSDDLHLLPAGEADLPFIMATERREGYGAVVGRWDAARHAAALRDGRHAYFIGQAGGVPVGFAILRDWASAERVTLLKRIAVTDPGQGWGRRLLAEVVAAVFERTEAHRLWLGVFPENLRARRAYEAVGFVAEGVARGSAFFGGVHRDELTMAILRPDWEAAPGRPAQWG
jgi:RimJ/RimL family protein N-acetyltransferase